MSKIRKIITTGLIATTLATAVVASTPASAWYRRYGGYYGGGWGWGGAPPSRPLDWERSRSGRSPREREPILIMAATAIPPPTAMLTRRDFVSHEARFTTTGAILSATSGCGWLAEGTSRASSSEFRRDRREAVLLLESRIKKRSLVRRLLKARTRSLRCFLSPTHFVDEQTHS